MEMTLKDYEINKSKIPKFLHGLKYAGPEIVQFLQIIINVSEIILFVFSYSFFVFQILNSLLNSSQL